MLFASHPEMGDQIYGKVGAMDEIKAIEEQVEWIVPEGPEDLRGLARELGLEMAD